MYGAHTLASSSVVVLMRWNLVPNQWEVAYDWT